eukprot:TRINITY_DN5948_c1_g2_i1.p1 TRINITY_DN5948_c1_g2~~TRINITY_DN5948_c1_g2_i1.p1  ORF type:complete len:406 (+),score=108.47 TRINITY_DN5948_c1_g2_i1:112-1329(+)
MFQAARAAAEGVRLPAAATPTATATSGTAGAPAGNPSPDGVTPSREATLSVSKQTGVGRFKIEGFSLLRRKKGEAVSSGPVIDIGDAQWEILVYPRGNDRCKDGWMRVSVRCLTAKRETKALYSVSVVNQAGDILHRLEEEANFTSGDGWGFDNFISSEKLGDPANGFTNDCVIFEASVTVFGQEVFTYSALEPRTGVVSVSEDLVSDFREMWRSGKRGDVVLRAEGQELRAHGLVLAARSPVFERMLSTEMEEKSSGLVEIVDVDYDNLKRLCEFIYTGGVEDAAFWQDAEAAAGLLQAAAKYEVLGLVRLCARKASEALSVESVAEWLMLAAQIGPQAEALKERCLRFTAVHMSEIQVTEGWSRLMQNSRVVSEVAPLLFQALSPPSAKRRKTTARRCETLPS